MEGCYPKYEGETTVPACALQQKIEISRKSGWDIYVTATGFEHITGQVEISEITKKQLNKGITNSVNKNKQRQTQKWIW